MNKRPDFNFSNRKIWNAVKILLLFFGVILGTFADAWAAAGVTLTATPNTNTVTVGQTTSYTIKINRDNYIDKVTLSVTGLPSGVTATFTPNTTTANSSTLKLQTLTSTPVGTFNLTVKGTAAGINVAPVTIKLITISPPSVSVSVLPAVQSIIAGQETSFEIAVNRLNFDGPVTLSAANVPPGITVRFEPPTTSGNTARMFLYSRGIPPYAAEYAINVQVAAAGLMIKDFKLMLYVNCGMVWVRQFAVPNPQTGIIENCRHPATGAAIGCPEIATAVTEDAAGNVYVAGRMIVPDGNGNFVQPIDSDAFVAKYDSAGNQLGIWVFQNPATQDFATDVAVDALGNIFVAGYKQINNDQTTASVFVGKVNTNGTILRSSGSIGFGFGEDGTSGMSLRADGSGGAFLTAAVNIQRQSGTFDSVPFITATFDIQQIYFSSNLGSIASTRIDSGIDGDPTDLAVGSDGSVNVTGNHAVFPGLPGGYPDQYIFTVKYQQANGIWARSWRNDVPVSHSRNINKLASKIGVAPNGDVFVGGVNYSPTSTDYWIRKIRADGCNTAACGAWLKNSGSNLTTISAIEVDSNGDVYYGGTTEGALAITRPPLNEKDAWFAKSLGSTGELIYIRQFDAVNKDELNAIKVGLNGDLLFAGYTVLFTGNNYGFEDVLLMKYRLEENVRNPPPSPIQLTTRVTGINPSSVRSGTTFTLQGIFGDVKAVFLNGIPTSFSGNNFTQLQAQAPTVTTTTSFNVTVSTGCRQLNAPVQLTVTP